MSAKPTRPYTSRLRREQAEQTRVRVVQAAAELFGRSGYAATTLPKIAERAGVSTETVQNYGPKPELLRAAIDLVSFAGGRDQPVLETELGLQLLAARTPHEAAQVAAEVLTAVNQAGHGLWQAFAEAARHDAALAAELRALTASIREQNALVIRMWHAKGWLRDDTPLEELTDRTTLIGAVELYDRFVGQGGGTVDRYRALIAGLLAASVLTD
ncbi:helix-turn-helix domain-containing protein [Hoyosella altamirensis]|uniref:AcrR family transcriptional regulator n=1 Tax=Hoyosella altamirensis TaxID=616997 RepID=A0A839RHN1_9ACTN|nr:helix-turn-helix domain-containing protein [Hoyosella altamirensis]MBB3035714.1 AcrR family transcriptional regulator [Hoyosella altamirensis]